MQQSPLNPNPGSTTSAAPSEPFLSPRRSLDAIFHPRNVAVIGATDTPRSVGRTLLWNLISSPFGGTVFPINPRHVSVLGIRAYRAIGEVPAPVDLAVIATPAATVPGIIAQCANAGVKGAIIISAGFRETGREGMELERRVLSEARRGHMRLIGPNCLGVMNPLTGLNATFAKGAARPGHVAFISQSGALLTAILDWSLREQVGFSAFVSTGSMLDTDWGSLIDYLGDDPQTQSILIYMESIGDARAFLSAAREVALNKPIIVIKAGRSEAAAKAASSHTGSMIGSDEVVDAAFRRCGVLRVHEISDLFSMAEVLAKQPRPRGKRLAVVTNAGGPGVLATDALLSGGGELASLSPRLRETLDGFLPPQWSHNNPIDVLGDAAPQRIAQTLQAVVADEENDGVLVILTPQDMTDPTQTAEAIKPIVSAGAGKPVLASWMGGGEVAGGRDILSRAGVPMFDFPDAAARAFAYMWRYSENLRALYETPALGDEAQDSENRIDPAAASRVIELARASGATLLDEGRSKEILAAYGIPVTQTLTAATGEEAAQAAEKMGFPVAIKLLSATITHKTDAGGVKLNLRGRQDVLRAFEEIRQSVTRLRGAEHFQGVTIQPMIDTRDGYELILGASSDPQFGPVLLFGAGGQLVEVFRDRALGLPPLNATLARRIMERTKIFKALQGVRGRQPVDLDRLSHIFVLFSRLIVEQPWVKEIEINPLIASADRIIALDARVVLWDKEKAQAALPRPAIRPYPSQYATNWNLRDGTTVRIHPIRPEDEPLVARFHQDLSERTVYFRYFHTMNLNQRIAHERLIRVCFANYDRDLALIAEGRDENGKPFILGIGRLSKIGDGRQAEYSVLIADRWQGRGLGTELLHRLIGIARDEKVERLYATVMAQNLEMQRVSEKLGFKITGEVTDATVVSSINPMTATI